VVLRPDAVRERLLKLEEVVSNHVLVHGYLRIDPARVAEHLAKAPADFSEFARQVRAWMTRVIPAPRSD
jgi:uncharacterized protein YutE (UPF0331/DUF86 family)